MITSIIGDNVKYTFRLQGYGGEFFGGNLTPKEIEFVTSKTEGELDQVLNNTVEFDIGDGLRMLPDDFDGVQVYGAYSSSLIIVEDEDGNEVLQIDGDDIEHDDDLYECPDLGKSKVSYACLCEEKGSFGDYYLELDDIKDLDLDKLAFHIISIDEMGFDMTLVDGILYEGKHLEFDGGGDTMGKGVTQLIYETDQYGSFAKTLYMN